MTIDIENLTIKEFQIVRTSLANVS